MSEVSPFGSVSNAVSNQLASRASQTLRNANAASDDSTIDKSSKEFESILLGSWLQQAERTFATVPGTDEEEEDSDSGKDQYMSLAMQSLGTAMSAAGGIGIAKMIAKQLHRAEDKETAQSAQK